VQAVLLPCNGRGSVRRAGSFFDDECALQYRQISLESFLCFTAARCRSTERRDIYIYIQENGRFHMQRIWKTAEFTRFSLSQYPRWVVTMRDIGCRGGAAVQHTCLLLLQYTVNLLAWPSCCSLLRLSSCVITILFVIGYPSARYLYFPIPAINEQTVDRMRICLCRLAVSGFQLCTDFGF